MYIYFQRPLMLHGHDRSITQIRYEGFKANGLKLLTLSLLLTDLSLSPFPSLSLSFSPYPRFHSLIPSLSLSLPPLPPLSPSRSYPLSPSPLPLSPRYNLEGDLLFSVAKDSKPTVWYSSNGERLGHSMVTMELSGV